MNTKKQRETWTYTIRAENHLPEDHPEHEGIEVSVTPSGQQERAEVHEALNRFLLTLLGIHGDTVTVSPEHVGESLKRQTGAD